MNNLLCIVGPTASGKTSVAVELSKILPIEVISCDSMQVYKGMPILTQAPSKELAKEVKTHLVSFLDPSLEYSAARFRKEAGLLIPKILKKGKLPIIVGGTGLYLRALVDGLFESEEGCSDRDPKLRQKLIEEQEKHGGDYLHRELLAVDPVAAEKIHPNDVRRLVRALEVFKLSGKPITEQKAKRSGIRDQYQIRIFMLDCPRPQLYERINQRVELMIKDGLLEEVSRLRKKKLSMTAEVALGFREMSAYLDGRVTLPEALDLLRKNTRHYAKRQISWFRHEKGVELVPVLLQDSAQTTAQHIVTLWRKGL